MPALADSLPDIMRTFLHTPTDDERVRWACASKRCIVVWRGKDDPETGVYEENEDGSRGVCFARESLPFDLFCRLHGLPASAKPEDYSPASAGV